MIYDTETLPNIQYGWDTISERPTPLEFIIKPKAIATIAWKWLGESETYVAVCEKPYDDRAPLAAFMEDAKRATHMVAHYSKFDKTFITGRLAANGMDPLPPVCDVCTYKMAKAAFGRSLNGNKLDNLGTVLGVGNKIKTNAMLWVRVASGDKDALEEMALYNKQDVNLLEQVLLGIRPYVNNKINLNLLTADHVTRCKTCNSDNVVHTGFEYTINSIRDRYVCKECKSYSTFPKKKVKKNEKMDA